MLATETTVTPGPLLGTAPMPLALRIRGTERGGQVVRLKSSKIAIGSSAKCALRLKAPGVAPLHCFILRGAQQTIVRRWNRDTRLNGGTFEDSPLFAGDRLSIGPIEFDVIEERAHGERRRRRDGEELTSVADLNQTASPTAIEAALAPLAERLELANTQGRRRARGLLTQLRAATRKAEQLERRVAEGREQSREIEHRWSQWEHDRRALDDERGRWQEVHTQTENLLARRREQLDDQARRLAADRKSLAADLAALDADRQALDERYHALDVARAELENKRTAWQQQRSADETARTAKLAELVAREEDLNRRAAELAEAKAQTAVMPVMVPVVAEPSFMQPVTPRVETPAEPLPNFAALLAEIAAERETLAAAREQWISDQAAKTAEQNHRAAELQNQEQELAARGQMLDRQQAELESQRQALAAAQEDFNRQRAELESKQQAESSHAYDADAALHARETELTERETQLQQREAELQTRQSELEQTVTAREAQWHQQCAALEARVGTVETHQQELAARQQQLEHDRQQFEADRAELTAQRQQLEADRAALIAQREQFHAEMEQRAAEPTPVTNTARDEVTETGEPLSTPTAEPEHAETNTTDDNTAAEKHDGDVFARLRALSLLRTDDATDGDAPARIDTDGAVHETANIEDRDEGKTGVALEPVVSEQVEVAPPRRVVQPAPPQHAEGEDESIDDYMAKLLQRMRGGDSEKPAAVARHAAPPVPEKSPPQASDNAATKISDDFAEPTTEEAPAKPAKPLKLEPRKAAPEKSVDLAAMRELANTSARAAIATHQKKRGWSKAWGKLGLGIVGLAGSAAALWKAPSLESPIFYGGIAGLVIATFWLAQAMFIFGRARLPRREEAKPLGKPAEEKPAAAQA